MKDILILVSAAVLAIIILPSHNQFSDNILKQPAFTNIFNPNPEPKKPAKSTPPKTKPKPTAAKSPVAASLPAPAPTPTPAPPSGRAYTYCVSAKGVDEANLPEVKAKLAAVYNDPRGWSKGGANTFTEVAAGCNFRVWLAAAELMPTFGAICDSTWSCTVTPNVILNFDRWRLASDAWIGGGGSLDDYRTMVINHETGHWFGFNHRYCAGAGQPAPVMQQQSIGLQGCTANPWPLPHEKAAL